jgi:hypothetical protein
MLVKWILVFVLTGLLLIATATAGFADQADQPAEQSPSLVVKQSQRQMQQLPSPTVSLLDSGFYSMYNLDFASAQQRFTEYQKENPDEPMGPVAGAAGLLFSEFDRLGVLQSQMFVKDASFRGRSKLAPDPAVRNQFEVAIQRGQAMAQERLAGSGNDRDALLAAALAAGLKADYLALVQKQNIAALSYTRQATGYAQRLLTVCPDCYDAYVATGISKYLIGSRAAPVRWILRARGFAGDKGQGIKELQMAAQHGRYLAPFARILLAIAYLRDKQPQLARVLLADLRAEFPQNTLFARELNRLRGTAE